MPNPLSPASIRVLKHIKQYDRASMVQLREAGVIDDFRILHRLYEANFVFPKSHGRPTEYGLTAKGIRCLQLGGKIPNPNNPDEYVRPADATPSRTIWNSTMREPYRTGMGRARVGLAMIGV